jgi:hypothetical protein
MGDLPDIDPHRDPRTEQLLDRRRVGWQLQWIRVDDIDWRTTTERQVRSDGIDDDRLQRYREALDAGATFPAVLAWDQASKGGWVLLGGIHRAQAHEANGLEWIPAYTVADPHEPYLLALEHNATHGDGLSTADKVRHAMTLVERHGAKRAEAARTVGISVHALDAARARAAGMARALNLGVATHYQRLTGGIQSRLQWCCQDHAVFVEAVRTASNARLTTAQVNEMATLISAADGAGPDALQAIEDYEAEHHPSTRRRGGGSGGHPPAASRARRAALQALDVAAAEVVDSCHPDDRKATADLAFRAGKHLAAIAAALNDKETT